MAIPILNHLDLRSVSELQNAILHKTTEASASNVEGKIIYDTGTDSPKFYNGSAWIDLGGDISRVNITAGNGLTGTVDTTIGEHTQTLTVVGGDGITANADEIEVTVDDSTIELSGSDGAGAVRIKDNGVTLAKLEHQSANAVFKVSGTGVPIAGTIDTDNITADAVTISKLQHRTVNHVLKYGTSGVPTTGTVDTDNITADAIDGTKIADDAINSEHYTNGSVDNIHLANDGITIGGTDVSLGGTITALTALTDLDLTAGNKTIFDTIGANTLTMGASGTTITIPGNLVVTGTTITKNETVKIVENNTIEFEGTTADDAHQIKLSGGEPTADRVVTLPDNSGTIALKTDITTRQFATTIGNASATTINLLNSGASAPHKNHGLGADSTQFMIQLIEVSTGLTVMADVARGSSGAVAITFSSAPAANAIRVLITKIG